MKKILSLILLTSIMSCSAQKKTTTITLKKMEKLNNQNFDNIQVNGEANFTLPNGDIVRQFEDKGSYIESISKKETPFETVNVFDKGTGALKATGENFYGFSIGILKEYDQNGVLIKETNFDEPFKFTIEALAQKIVEELHVNIMMKTTDVTVYRTTNPTPTYQLFYPVIEGNPRWLNILVFDGVTGSLTYKGTSKTVE